MSVRTARIIACFPEDPLHRKGESGEGRLAWWIVGAALFAELVFWLLG